MRKIFVLFLFFSWNISGQHSYDIDAKFDPKKAEISINQTLTFINNYEIELNYLILNDWAHSYSTSLSNLGKRLSEEYILSFQRSTKNQRGYTAIKKISNQKNLLNFSRLENNIDLIKVELRNPLKPKDSLKINIIYDVKIPIDDFTGYGISNSRNINIRDWYLTFAGIDKDEWKTESNLDLNDLFHDPAYFKFKISYPKDYTLISDITPKTLLSDDAKNIIFDSKKEIRKNSNLILSQNPNFKVYAVDGVRIYSDVENKEGKSDSLINKLITFFDKKTGNNIPLNNIDENDIKKNLIVDRIFRFANEKIGVYPFNTMIVSRKNQSRRPIYGINNLPKIISPFDQSFLFEYNFLKEFLHTYLEEAITFDKRKRYWETDGIVIFLMMNYIEKYYPELKFIGKYSEYKIFKNRNYASYSFNDQFRLFENIISSRNINQTVSTPRDSLTRINLKIINPYKAGLGLKMLSKSTQKNKVENSIKKYYKKNKLTSLDSKSLKHIIQNETNNSSTWFFDEHLGKKFFLDYDIRKINETEKNTFFKISKSIKSSSPVQISLLKKDNVMDEKWVTFNNTDTIVSFNSKLYDFVELNKNRFKNETNFKNNFASFNKYTKPTKFVLFNDFDNIYQRQLNYIPLLGYNLYDGLMPGMTLTNLTLIKKPFGYKFKPFYSSKQKKILGSMSLKYTKYSENKKLFSTQYFISASTFHYKENLSYSTFFPSLTFTFRNKDLRSNFRQFLYFKYISVYREENLSQKDNPNYNIFNAKYILSDSYGGKGISLNTDLQINKSFIKTSITAKYRNYYKDNRQYNLRIFLGKFLNNKTNDDFFSFSTFRPRDYMFNYNILGRSETTGFYSQQFINTDGAMKSRVNPEFSNNWMFSINTGTTIWQWIEAYYDFIVIKNKGFKVKTAFDSGIRLNILTDYFELFFPFYSSIGNELKMSNYSEKIRFKITIDPNTVSGLFTRRWF